MALALGVTDRLVAKRVLQTEAEAICALIDRVDDRFDAAVRILAECEGRVITTGVGKSGLVARKVAATLASTGTPAFFLHPTEAAHGDIGVMQRGDAVIGMSSSGETQEVLFVVTAARRAGVPVIALTGNLASPLARAADAAIDCHVSEEACPFNLVPTASTTAALALGDALCMTLLVSKGFTQADFASLHPGGKLGRQVSPVEHLMHAGAAVPRVSASALMHDVIHEMSCKALGMTCVVDADGRLLGVITDGDLRRHMMRNPHLLQMQAAQVMTPHPVVVSPASRGADVLAVMEQRRITAVVVVDDHETVLGIVQMRDLCA
jgi:arabinose-5-phosphate isomerase